MQLISEFSKKIISHYVLLTFIVKIVALKRKKVFAITNNLKNISDESEG